MAVYSTGSVRVKVGSNKVIGSSTDFSTYVKKGYLFKLASEAVFYDIAAVNTATNIILSSNYVNADYYNTYLGEHNATITTATKMYSGYVDNTPVLQNYFSLNASIETFTDNGAGVLVGNASPAGSGTIDYTTGLWNITLGTDLTATADLTASYKAGGTISSSNYQIIKDYTPHLRLPEISVSDLNIAQLITKSLRLIDAAFFKHKTKSVSADYTATTTDRIINVEGNSTKVYITLTPSVSANVGRHLTIINNSASDVIATVYESTASIRWIGGNGLSITMNNQWQTLDFMLATAGKWNVR